MSYYLTPIKLSLNASDSFRLANIRDLVEFKDHRKNVKTEEKTYYSYVGKHLTPRGGSDFEGVGGI